MVEKKAVRTTVSNSSCKIHCGIHGETPNTMVLEAKDIMSVEDTISVLKKLDDKRSDRVQAYIEADT